MNNELIQAIVDGDLDTVQKELCKGINPNEPDESGWTALHWAAQEGCIPIVFEILKHGANANAADNRGFTPLAVAAGEGADSAVCQLVQWGASAKILNPSNSHGSPLHVACAYGHLEAARALVELSDVEINRRDDNGMTALGFAVRKKNEALIEYLKSKGAVI
jgi:ankyrin repeat protein